MAFVTRPAGTGGSVTSEEFLAGPERPGVLLLNGEVFMNDATHEHQELCSRLFGALHDWKKLPQGHGRLAWGGNWVLSSDTVVKPDVFWFADAEALSGPRHDGPPDLAIEVLSPGTRHLDLGVKRDSYREAGLPELWIVDARNHMVFARRFAEGEDEEFGEGMVLVSPLLPGFWLPVDELFTDLG